ncbi:MAG TPA: hypothetical protein VN627_08460, partial [Novosphingobium sp.]|nr:hypothetical protein [Novosphingobium sp.]
GSDTPFRTPGGGGDGPSSGGDAAVTVARLETHLAWVKKGLGGLAVVSLGALAWIFYNIYQPMQVLVKDSAVQTQILAGMNDDISKIGDRLDRIYDHSQAIPGVRQTEPPQSGKGAASRKP